MTESEIASILVKTFQQQCDLYRALERINQQCQELIAQGKGTQALLSLLQQKKEKMSAISSLDLTARSAKEQWQTGKTTWQNTELKKQIEESLSKLTQQVSLLMTSEKRVGEMMQQRPASMSKQSAAGKYKAQGGD